jgi:hypothetical protein
MYTQGAHHSLSTVSVSEIVVTALLATWDKCLSLHISFNRRLLKTVHKEIIHHLLQQIMFISYFLRTLQKRKHEPRFRFMYENVLQEAEKHKKQSYFETYFQIAMAYFMTSFSTKYEIYLLTRQHS